MARISIKEHKISYHHIYINGIAYMYEIIPRATPGMYMKLDRRNHIIVSKHEKITMNEVEYFIKQNIDKFAKHQTNRASFIIIDKNQHFLTINNEKHSFKVMKSTRNKYELLQKTFYIHTTNVDEYDKIIKKLYYDYAIKALEPLFIETAKTMHLPYEGIAFKWLISKWGCCNFSKKTITLATQLAAFEQKYQHYVIVHELAHLLYPNHSSDFWSVVSTYCPDWKHTRKFLNNCLVEIE